MNTPTEGIVLVDKPIGITSFDVIRRLRKTLGIKKIGHAGTLDPLASGLMVLGVGPGTKLLTRFIKLPKVYEAEVCLGESTTTGDREGDIIATTTVTGLTCYSDAIENALVNMLGTLSLRVPAYSAIKQGGEALYKKARRGEQVETPVKPMEVREATLLDVREDQERMFVKICFDVGSGTYIRSLAEELGRRLGHPARLENLRRTQVGEWCVEDAIQLT